MTLSKRFLSFLFLGFAIIPMLMVSGCGVVRDRSGDYTKAESGSGIVVPPWYRQDVINESYPIPDITNNQVLSQDFKVPAPPDAVLRILKEQFSVEVNEDQVWLLVNEPPSRVWPSIERFLSSQGVSFSNSNPQLGLAQASLPSNSALIRTFTNSIGLDESKSHVLQILVSQGLKRNTAEVQMRLLEDDGANDFKAWQGESSGLNVEKAVLEKTKDYMIANKDDKSFSLLASDIGGPSKVALVADGDLDSYLKLDLDYDRSWSVVLRAIRDAKLPVADIDRSEGVVYLDVEDNDDKCGFFSWFCSSEKSAPEYDFKVNLKTEKDYVKVYVANMVDPEDTDSQSRILALLLENAS